MIRFYARTVQQDGCARKRPTLSNDQFRSFVRKMNSGWRRVCRQQRRRRVSSVGQVVAFVGVAVEVLSLEELCFVFDQLPVGQLPVNGDLREEVPLFVVAAVHDRLHAQRNWYLKDFRVFRNRSYWWSGWNWEMTRCTFEVALFWAREQLPLDVGP